VEASLRNGNLYGCRAKATTSKVYFECVYCKGNRVGMTGVFSSTEEESNGFLGRRSMIKSDV
jgi:hypothetical protein